MNQVRIVPSSKTGNVVSTYESNKEFGYIQLEQSALVQDGAWIREVKRSCLLRAQTSILEKFVAANKSLTLAGNLVVLEYLESEVPEDIKARYFRKDVTYEEAIVSYVKRAGNDGVELTFGGERILRFTEYDPSAEKTDKRVAHDNQDAVAAARAADAASAVLGKK
jgi:hypothetical protein